jgi:hypothetical protein
MRAIQLRDAQGEPITDPKRVASLLHEHHHRCMSPFFGLWVALAVVAVAALGWAVLAGVLV